MCLSLLTPWHAQNRWYYYIYFFLSLEVLVTLSCPTLGDPKTVACQAPQSLGILQARLLEWVAVPSSSGSSRPRDRTWVSRIAGALKVHISSVTLQAKLFQRPLVIFCTQPCVSRVASYPGLPPSAPPPTLFWPHWPLFCSSVSPPLLIDLRESFLLLEALLTLDPHPQGLRESITSLGVLF